MKGLNALLLLLSSFLPIAAQTKPAASFFAKTGPPALIDNSGGGVIFVMTEDEYRKFMKRVAGVPSFIEVKNKPAGLSADARFGLNLSINGKNIGWIIDGSEARGYVFYADWNADGNLANDPPTKLRKNDGQYAHLFSKTLTEIVNGKKRKYLYEVKIEVAMLKPTGENAEKLAVRMYGSAARRGTLELAGRRLAFELTGSRGIYDTIYDNLYFDLNGDGKFDADAYSPEKYKISEKYLTYGETTYEFTVDRYGESLTLTPLAEKRPGRADLSTGKFAPEFSFRDLDGKTHRLSDFRQKVVLLDFWGLWCAPCVAEAPKLAAAYQRLKDKGFEILSFDKGDTVEDLRTFTGKTGMNWTHSQIDDDLSRLYRIDRFPTYFLLDKEGRIVSNTLRPGEEFYRKIEDMLDD
jgi:thiol-disulfide isomerase/thioredoxin